MTTEPVSTARTLLRFEILPLLLAAGIAGYAVLHLMPREQARIRDDWRRRLDLHCAELVYDLQRTAHPDPGDVDLFALVGHEFRGEEDLEAYLIRRADRGWLRLSPLAGRGEQPASFRPREWPGATDLVPGSFLFLMDDSGVPVRASISAVPATPWFVVVQVAEAHVTEQVNRHLATIGGEALALTAAFSLVSFALAHRRRLRANDRLRRLELRYESLFEGNPHPMYVYDPATLRILEVNEAAVRHYGYDRQEWLRMSLCDIRPQEDVPRLREVLARRRDSPNSAGRWRHRTKDGRTIHVDVVAHDIRFGDRPARLVVASDITERIQLEEQVRQAQKMEAVGRLAGGVAHDFNNLLTVIAGFSDLALRELGDEHSAAPHVREVVRVVGRGAALTRSLLAFSRKQNLQPQVLDLNATVAGTEKMLRRLLGADIEVRTILAAGLAPVLADPAQIEQILLNLAVNARDAMPAGGRLSIETGEAVLDEDYVRLHPGSPRGPHVMLAVTDTGVGLTEDAKAHLFEPFYTTKGVGRGTGLGLATIYGIVQQSGGSIDVQSEAGKGAAFRVFLPRADAGVTTVDLPTPEPPPRGGTESILVAEDEEGVARVAMAALSGAGYAVEHAPDGQAALETALRRPGAIDLLLTDLVMPKLGGLSLAEQLRALRPNLRVLYMSGYAGGGTHEGGALPPGAAFLQKPFAAHTLLTKVRATLDGAIRAWP